MIIVYKTKEGYLTIGIVARICKIHPQTLRLYEKEGLLRPNRSKGNTRFYSEEDLERIRLIRMLTEQLRVNLAGVEIILSMREKVAQMQNQMQTFVQEFIERFKTMVEQDEASSLKKNESRDKRKIINVKIESPGPD